MASFDNRDVAITGGTGALGTALVGKLVEAGARCHVPYFADRAAEHFAHRNHKQVVLTKAGDLADEESVERFYATAEGLWASIHIAGGFAMSPIANTDKASLMAMIDTNFVTGFLCCRAAVGKIRSSGKGGRIVNVAARPALEPRTGAGMVAYTASKAAVAAMTEALAQEVAGDDILVNAVAPSTMDTAANRAAMPKADFAAWPKVEDVAATILFLASPENRVTRGAIVPVYGRS